MPGRDGAAVARTLLADAGIDPKPRLVIVTAYGENDAGDTFAGLDIAGCLAKPVSAAAVREAVTRAPAAQRPAPPPSQRRRLGDPQDMDRLRGARVLLAEDHAINRDLAVEILTAGGLAVDVAQDGEAAVAKAVAGRYDAVLMDVQMPALDGYEATRRIRAELGSAAPPIIAMTADAAPSHQERAMSAGMSDHLSKPVDVHALFAKLAHWVRSTAGQGSATAASARPAATPQIPLHRSMLARFCDEYRGFAAGFAAARAAPQPDAPLRLAHTLKGVAANLGLTEIARSADALEAACRNGSDDPALTALAIRIDGQVAALDADAERLTPPDTEPAPCCEIPAMDPECAGEYRALAERLLGLLDSGDAEALDVAARLAAGIGTDSDLGRRLAGLHQRVEAFEFAPAAKDLRALQEPLSRLGGERRDLPANAASMPPVAALTDRLADLLDGDDTDAGTVAEDLVRALDTRPHLAATARRIAHSVDEFDYTAARRAVAELRRQQAQEAEGDR
jgi:CheY-like chemotaxis protein/HPt (histidine-containing phosphotransfer) domain-containing protein